MPGIAGRDKRPGETPNYAHKPFLLQTFQAPGDCAYWLIEDAGQGIGRDPGGNLKSGDYVKICRIHSREL
ncbi:hypothetical protein GCM10027562_39020 [Arthrobacter pigmenti]